MKNRILTFIIGMLVGAILTTTGFLMYSKGLNKNSNGKLPVENNRPIQPPSGIMGEPPAKPDGDFREQIPENM